MSPLQCRLLLPTISSASLSIPYPTTNSTVSGAIPVRSSSASSISPFYLPIKVI
ncbi:unnamed protein product, partial [Linum tenue]